MSVIISTASGVGALSTGNEVVVVIEFKARVGNTSNAYIGTSGMSSGDGRELAPGDSYVINFSLPDVGRHAGRVLLSSLYTDIRAGDYVDYTVITRDPAS